MKDGKGKECGVPISKARDASLRLSRSPRTGRTSLSSLSASGLTSILTASRCLSSPSLSVANHPRARACRECGGGAGNARRDTRGKKKGHSVAGQKIQKFSDTIPACSVHTHLTHSSTLLCLGFDSLGRKADFWSRAIVSHRDRLDRVHEQLFTMRDMEDDLDDVRRVDLYAVLGAFRVVTFDPRPHPS